MIKYQASKRVILGSLLMGLTFKVCRASRIAMPPTAIASISQLCSPEFMKGTNIMGSMGVDGFGGVSNNYRMGAPTLCIKEGRQDATARANGRISPLAKRLSHHNAFQALMNLQDTDCRTGKVHPKTQACFLFKTIQKKAQAPTTAITTAGNALFLKKKGKVSAMIVIERFGSLTPKKKEPVPLEKLLGKPNSNVVFNEFDDILKREGTPNMKSSKNKCADCLKFLKRNIMTGTDDMECDMCNDSIAFDFGSSFN